MQGTGTQTDPYIPESWADFVTAMETNDAYIEVPKNTVYDMSAEYTAYMPTINVRCSRVLGNGVVLRNLMEPQFQIARASGGTVSIYNMRFEKIVKSNDNMFTSYNGSVAIMDSEFYGMFPFRGTRTSPSGIMATNDYWTMYRCSGNIELTAGGDSDGQTFRLAGRVTDCNFTIRVPDTYTWGAYDLLFPTSFSGGMTGSVIQYEGPERATLATASSGTEYTHDNILVYPGGWAAVQPPSGSYVATEEQYKSAAWLRSKGFRLPYSEVL